MRLSRRLSRSGGTSLSDKDGDRPSPASDPLDCGVLTTGGGVSTPSDVRAVVDTAVLRAAMTSGWGVLGRSWVGGVTIVVVDGPGGGVEDRGGRSGSSSGQVGKPGKTRLP